jgi:farnesyl-diphosphate farnesyltransferase
MDYYSREVCFRILPLVSRSFGLAIKLLPTPMREQLTDAYLYYRLLDTVEDSDLTVKQKQIFLDKINKLFSNKEYDKTKIEELKKSLLIIKCDYEKILLENLEHLYFCFYSHPQKIRRAILKWGKEMSRGMIKFQQKKINTLIDQDRYSYYVAGVVGYLFNDLLYYNQFITKKTKKKLQKYAKKFGIALQKINIIKDIKEDAKENRYFWPIKLIEKYGLDYKTMFLKTNLNKSIKILNYLLKSIKNDIKDAIKYIKSLPKNQIKIRIFCLIPLFMALESYAKLFNNKSLFELDQKIKITRKQVYYIALKAALFGNSNKMIQKWFLNSLNKLPTKTNQRRSSVDFEDFQDLLDALAYLFEFDKFAE